MIHVADCRQAMAAMEPESVDAIVSDPPYGLSFMGKGWDHSVPGVEFWREAWRVAKPGAHLVAFGGTRTYHRLVCAIEDAGWEIRDQLAWLFGSGFPKSLNLDGEREGWGTALKPAHEPIVLARKPLIGTVAANVTAHGTGALNVDGCRVEGALPSVPQPRFNSPTGTTYGFKAGEGRNGEMSKAAGRWPANVILDEVAGAMLDDQSGERRGGGFPCRGLQDVAAHGAADAPRLPPRRSNRWPSAQPAPPRAPERTQDAGTRRGRYECRHRTDAARWPWRSVQGTQTTHLQ